MLTLTWQDHNRILQADQVVAYDDGDTGREDGQQTVVEWRFGTTSEGPWGEPTTSIVTAPQTASYTPPGDGWVQITCYSTARAWSVGRRMWEWCSRSAAASMNPALPSSQKPATGCSPKTAIH